MEARDIMSMPPITVFPDTPLKEVGETLLGRRISGVPVVERDGSLAGIVTEADLVPLEAVPDSRTQVNLRSPGPPKLLARDVMTTEVVALPPDADVARIANLMIERGIKRVPIVDGEKLVGIVARRDLLKILVRPDGDIYADIQALLEAESRVLGPYTVDVQKGVVHLNDVANHELHYLAARLIRSVPGVVDVTFDQEHLETHR
jgi:CBS domain-containing protein